ncbi:MAG: hypothetical protein V1746_08700 [bacterium]
MKLLNPLGTTNRLPMSSKAMTQDEKNISVGEASFLERRGKKIAWAVLGALFLLVSLLIIVLETKPDPLGLNIGYIGFASYRITMDRAHDILFFACFLACAASAVYFLPLLSRQKPVLLFSIQAAALAGLMLFSGFTYFYIFRGVCQRDFLKNWDLYHYFLGPKYFNELGYTGIYGTSLAATQEMGLRLPGGYATDLDNYSVATVEEAMQRFNFKNNFTPERWDQFKQELHFFYSTHGRRVFGRMCNDHGYNGSPGHTVFAQFWANLIPVNYRNMTLVSLIDIALLFAAFALVCHSFGWRLGALFFIFYCVNFTNRYDPVGGSFMRYAWIAALVAGVCMLKLKKPSLGGALIGLSAMLNIFPVVFAGGIGVKMIFQFLKEKRFAREHLRFVGGFLAACALVFLLTLTLRGGHGLKTWRDFLHKMSIHSSRLTQDRIGFPYLFVYHGEITPEDSQVSYRQKQRELDAMKPFFWAIVGGVLVLTALAASKLDDATASVLVGVMTIFLIFSLVRYYYAVAALLMLLWHGQLKKRGGFIGVVLLFLMMAIAFYAWQKTGYRKFVHNTVMSFSLAVCLAYTLGYFAYTQKLFHPLIQKWRGKYLK